MQFDIDRGVCENHGCNNYYTHTVTWAGAEPAYVCPVHKNRKRYGNPVVAPVENPHNRLPAPTSAVR